MFVVFSRLVPATDHLRSYFCINSLGSVAISEDCNVHGHNCPADILLISFNLLAPGVRGGVIHNIVMQSGPPVARSNPLTRLSSSVFLVQNHVTYCYVYNYGKCVLN
jgi:hypothetical protein